MTKVSDINKIISTSIEAVLPDKSVIDALQKLELYGNVHTISIGKAAWTMSNAASEWLQKKLEDQYKGGICITKYDHSQGEIPNVKIYEAGHPTPDNNTVHATQEAINYAKKLTEDDTVLFLVSGGGSALFECPTCSLEEFIEINNNLLASGKDIVEMNTERKK